MEPKLKPAELRQEALSLSEKINDLRTKERTDEVRTELRTAIEDLNVLDTLISSTERESASNGPKGGTRSVDGQESRSLGEMFIEDEGYRSWGGQGNYEAELRTLVGSTGLFAATHTDGPGLLRPAGTPVFAPFPIRPRLFVRDVLTSVQTNLAIVPYLQEKNYLTNVAGADAVAEGAAKPEVVVDFTAADAVVRKIAAWIPATYEILQDAPTLRGYIDNFLRDAVAYREDRELLNGSGSGAHIRGLLNTTGLQTQAFDTDPFVSIGKAVSKIEVINGEASFLVMNPADYWNAQLTRFSTHFAGEAFQNPAPFGSPPAEIWGIPVVRSTGMAQGTALLGDKRGAVILDREGVTVRVGDQHLDYFTTNKVAILAEERLGLAVHRPDFFCSVAVVASGS